MASFFCLVLQAAAPMESVADGFRLVS